jgi:hypothetical protein
MSVSKIPACGRHIDNVSAILPAAAKGSQPARFSFGRYYLAVGANSGSLVRFF